MATDRYLFLDRDGVINTRIPGEYIRSVSFFEFAAGTPEALALLRPLFKRIIVVTNQAGIGKQLMTEGHLSEVHRYMQEQATSMGCPFDGIYHCPNLASDRADCRKPNTGMGIQAQLDFPEIIFNQSWMVGDSHSDIVFGQRLGMKTAKVLGKENETAEGDWHGDSLLDFALFMVENIKG